MAVRLDAPPCPVAQCTNGREWTGQSFASICRTHRARKKVHGSTLAEHPIGSLPPRWDPREPCTYKHAHWRVRSVRGRAADHACADCGGQAKQWSYNHNAEHEFRGPVVSPRNGVAYEYVWSGDPNDYSARCMSCHYTLDGSFKR